MTRPLRPTPADDIGADLEPVWDRLASHASAAPPAGPELTARVQGAMLGEFDRALRPTAHRPVFVLRPLVRPSSLRSLVAAAALVALLGASVALAGAGVAHLNQVPLDQPTPSAEQSDEPDGDNPRPIMQPPAQPGPDGIEDPDEGDGDVDEDVANEAEVDEETDDPNGAETDDPGDADRPGADEPEDDPSDEPSDSPDDSPDDSPGDDPSDEPEADEPD